MILVKNDTQIVTLIESIVKKMIDAYLNSNNSKNNVYYKRTEQLLRSYPDLKKLVKNTDSYLMKYQKSKDIVRMPSGSFAFEDTEELRIQSRKESLELTIMDLEWIDKALEEVRDDEYFEIIKLRYFLKKTIPEVAEAVNLSESTVKRHRTRLVKRITILLNGSRAENI